MGMQIIRAFAESPCFSESIFFPINSHRMYFNVPEVTCVPDFWTQSHELGFSYWVHLTVSWDLFSLKWQIPIKRNLLFSSHNLEEGGLLALGISRVRDFLSIPQIFYPHIGHIRHQGSWGTGCGCGGHISPLGLEPGVQLR